MKARIAFYFAAVVALVLFLAAAVPSHATQHRDPVLPEATQKTQPGPSPKSSGSAHASEAAPENAHPDAKQDSNKNSGVNPSFEPKDKTPAKRSSSGSAKIPTETRNHAGSSNATK